MYDPTTAMASRSPMDAPFSSGEGEFWGRLFDLSFTTFITPQLIRVLYVLGMLIAVFIAVGGVIVALTQSFWAFIWALVFTPVWLAVVFVVLRVFLEIAIVLFRTAQASIQTAQNTSVADTRRSQA